MFKNIASYKRKDRMIGNPVLLETTYDERALRSLQDISTLNSPTSVKGPGPTSPEALYHKRSSSQDPSPRIPSLPFKRTEPLPHQYYENFERTGVVSSVYSQPSPPTQPNEWDGQQNAAPKHTHYEVSPPSSPESPRPQEGGYVRSRSVSPVEEELNLHTGSRSNRYSSHIPIPRKPHPGAEHPRQTNATSPIYNQSLLPKQVNPGDRTTRWDDFSGEPSATGKPPQVKPGGDIFYAYPNTLTPHGLKMGYDVSVSAGNTKQKKPLVEKAQKFGNKALLSVDTRPPWKGASGRETIVEPVADKPLPYQSPVPIPRRSSKRPSPPESDRSSSNTPSSARRAKSPEAETPQVASHMDLTHLDDEPIKPIVPLKVGRNSPPRYMSSPLSSPTHNGIAGNPYPSPITPSTHVHYGQSTPTSAAPAPLRSHPTKLVSRLESEAPRHAVQRKSIDTVASINRPEHREPSSRFSWTTYTTSEYHHSPPPSPPPPMPIMIATQTPVKPPSPLLNRRRPLATNTAAATSTPTPATRKPVPSPEESIPTPKSLPKPHHMSQISTTSRRTSTNPGEKALPMSPPTLSSTDLVSSLEAQLEDLALQRRNLQKVMRDIQNLRAQSPVVVGFKVMRETGTKLKQLEEDLADVRQMEHEVGLRLHRAWKRKEECEGAEPSAFWVRRVTG